MVSSRIATHRVSRGESLWSIAGHYYGRPEFWPLIRSANPGRVAKGGDLILVGTELGIPAAPTREERPQLQGSRGGGGPKGAEAISGDIYPPRAVGSLTGPFGGRPVMGHPEGVPHQGRGQVVGGASGRTPAALCGMPKIKYDLRKLPEARFEIHVVKGLFLDVVLSHKGSVSLSKLGSCSPFAIQHGKYQFEAQRVFQGMVADIRLSVPSSDKKGFSLQLYGRSLTGMTSISIKGINRFSVKSMCHPIEQTMWGWKAKGEIGFEIDVTVRPVGSPLDALRVLTVEAVWQIMEILREREFQYAVVGGLILVGALVAAEVTLATLVAAGLLMGCVSVPYEVAALLYGDLEQEKTAWGATTI